MKRIVFVFAILLISSSAFAKNPKGTAVMQLAALYDIFYIKVCKTMVHATVEVYDPAGKLVATQNLDKRKLIIDFFDMAPGDYKVKLTKGGAEQVFDYHRKDFMSNDMAVASGSATDDDEKF